MKHDAVAERLAPCPFCGSSVHVTRGSDAMGSRYRVECKDRWHNCPVNLRTHHCALEEEAVTAWNTRLAYKAGDSLGGGLWAAPEEPTILMCAEGRVAGEPGDGFGAGKVYKAMRRAAGGDNGWA